MKYIVDIKGEIEGDYEIIGKYEERPQGDLISREALKKKFKDESYWTYTHEYGDAIPIGWILSAIDNAPTVELTETEVQEVLNKRCMTAVANEYLIALHGKTERPQGEWIIVSRNCWKCPYCQELTNEGKNFCPNCGADMRGVDDDERT